MKLITFACIFMAAGAAFSFPTLNDKASFSGVYNSVAGEKIAFTQDFELTAFDEPTFMYTLKTTSVMTATGQVETETMQIREDQLLHNDLVKYLLENCASQGGKLEKVTVPAGTYETCAVPTEGGGTTWIGQAPFGMVKIKNVDEKGNVIDLELKSFVDGSVSSN